MIAPSLARVSFGQPESTGRPYGELSLSKVQKCNEGAKSQEIGLRCKELGNILKM